MASKKSEKIMKMAKISWPGYGSDLGRAVPLPRVGMDNVEYFDLPAPPALPPKGEIGQMLRIWSKNVPTYCSCVTQ